VRWTAWAFVFLPTPPPLFKDPNKISTLVHSLCGTDISVDQVWEIMGINPMRTEREFNIRAGLSPANDKPPEYVYVEPLAPTNEVFDISEQEILKAIV
jgi:aldehyde:ferredoxin oxidoreductase